MSINEKASIVILYLTNSGYMRFMPSRKSSSSMNMASTALPSVLKCQQLLTAIVWPFTNGLSRPRSDSICSALFNCLSMLLLLPLYGSRVANIVGLLCLKGAISTIFDVLLQIQIRASNRVFVTVVQSEQTLLSRIIRTCPTRHCRAYWINPWHDFPPRICSGPPVAICRRGYAHP